MTLETLAGAGVAILIEDDFDDREVAELIDALRAAGATVALVGFAEGRTHRGRDARGSVTANVAAGKIRIADFDALVIPGGHAPDRIRMRHVMVDLARDAVHANRIVGAIGHGPQVLISADVVRGRTVTCWPSIAVDVKNAGGLYVDRPVVEDANLITCRKLDDLPAFIQALVDAIALSRARHV